MKSSASSATSFDVRARALIAVLSLGLVACGAGEGPTQATSNEPIALHHEETGSGAPLVFVHGLGSSGIDWEYQVPAFATGHRVITVDLRGHGRSPRPPGPYSIPQMTGDLAALLDRLGIADAHIVGLSMGGAVAFQLAADAPQRVRTLTIVNSGPQGIPRTLKGRALVAWRLTLLKLFGLSALGETIANKLFPDERQQALRDTFVERLARNDEAAYVHALNALVGWSVDERVAAITVPALIVAADQDYTPVSFKEEYVARMPNARLVIVPDSHHALPLERPDAFNEVLAAFLAEHP